ncbi:MAG: galactokinase [Bryobacteraceae bacterium]
MKRTFRAPGRVNLIGEHTDYNLGFVLPVALDLATWITAEPSTDGMLHVFSEARNARRAWPVSEIPGLTRAGHWSDYVAGVAQQLVRHGYAIEPQRLSIRSTIPEGAGLSSSAALEVAATLALSRDPAPAEVVRIAHRAEVEFVGLPCGMMDQYVSVYGHENSALKIDCRSLTHEIVRLPPGALILIVNSMVKHELGKSAYAQRVEECRQAAAALGVASLRDATMEQLERIPLPDAILRRARHVILENGRVLRFVEASGGRDLPGMGRLLLESHRSLRDDYEVSAAELDFLVEKAMTVDGVLGARMTGGGFGGCILALLGPDAEARFRETIQREYRRKFGLDPAIYPCRPAAGVGEIPAG